MLVLSELSVYCNVTVFVLFSMYVNHMCRLSLPFFLTVEVSSTFCGMDSLYMRTFTH